MQSCSTEEALMQNETIIKTVSREQAIQFLQQNPLRTSSNKATKTSNSPNYDAITQEEISNSDQLLTVIPLANNYKTRHSRIVLLTINDTIKSAIVTMYPDDEQESKEFSGRVFISNLNGDFFKGFRMKNGYVISKFIKEPTSSTLRKSAHKTALVNDPEKPIQLKEVVVPLRKKVKSLTVAYLYVYSWEIDSSNNLEPDWAFGGGGGGGGAEPAAEEENPCSIGIKITKDAQSPTFISAKSNIEKASSDGLEHSITLGRDTSGNITQSSIRTGGQNAVSVNTSWSGAFASLHNHPNNTQLSAGDIYSSIKLNTMNSNFTTSYILTNGQLYSIVVTDLAAAQAFATAYPADQLPGFNPEFPDFLFNQLQALVTSMGSSVDGKTGAIAYVLNQYNAGITLLKQNNVGEFEPIKPEVITNSDRTKSYTTKPCN